MKNLTAKSLMLAVFALLFAGSAHFGRSLADPHSGLSPMFWPTLGIYLGFLTLSSDRMRPWVVATAWAAWVLDAVIRGELPDGHLGALLVPILANTIAALVGASLLRADLKGGRPELNGRCLASLLFKGTMLVTLVNCGMMAALGFFRREGQFQLAALERTFWSDVFGIMTMTPTVLAFSTMAPRPWSAAIWKRVARGAFSLLLVGACAVFVFAGVGLPASMSYPLLIAPVFMWIAFRGNLGLTAGANTLVSIVAIFFTSRGIGPFIRVADSAAQQIEAVQVFVAVTIVVSWLLTLAVSERQRAATALRGEIQMRRQAEERLSLAVSASGLGVWEIQSDAQVAWSPKALAILGMDADEELDHQGFLERLAPEVREQVRESLSRMGENDNDTLKTEVCWRLPNGGERHLKVHAKTIARRTVGTIADISAEVIAREALHRANEAALAATEAKSRFLATMSHEIRAPLNALLGYTDLLNDPELSQSEREDFLAVIRRNGLHLSELVNQILDLAKVESGRIEAVLAPVVFAELVADVGKLMQVSAKQKGLALVWDVAPGAPAVIATDALRVRQILINGISNAIKFTARGEVRLKASAQAVRRGCWRLRFDIEDTGIGMDEAESQRLFQLFTQAGAWVEREYGGTGLGLVLSRRLARLLGGDFALVHTLKGVGSTFRLEFEAESPVEVVAPAGRERSAQANSGPLSGLSILLADDAADNRVLARRLLMRAGAGVTSVENGMAALQSAAEQVYDVFLLDFEMPELDGLGAATELRRRGITAPIVALTAHAMADEIDAAIAAGFDGHVSKPIDMKVLVETIQRLVQRQGGLPTGESGFFTGRVEAPTERIGSVTLS